MTRGKKACRAFGRSRKLSALYKRGLRPPARAQYPAAGAELNYAILILKSEFYRKIADKRISGLKPAA